MLIEMLKNQTLILAIPLSKRIRLNACMTITNKNSTLFEKYHHLQKVNIIEIFLKNYASKDKHNTEKNLYYQRLYTFLRIRNFFTLISLCKLNYRQIVKPNKMLKICDLNICTNDTKNTVLLS